MRRRSATQAANSANPDPMLGGGGSTACSITGSQARANWTSDDMVSYVLFQCVFPSAFRVSLEF